MKKIMLFVLSMVMVFSLCACGGNGGSSGSGGSSNAKNKLSLGEMASTDLAEFTLQKAEFAFYVDNTINDNQYKPIDDTDTIYAASKGNCLVALTFTVKNNDRAGSISYCGAFAEWEPGWKVTYNKETYDVKGFDLNMNEGSSYMELSHSAVINLETDEVIESHNSTNYLIDAGETVTLRTFGIINTEPENLTDGFDFTVQVPTAEGKYEEFTYSIPAQK